MTSPPTCSSIGGWSRESRSERPMRWERALRPLRLVGPRRGAARRWRPGSRRGCRARCVRSRLAQDPPLRRRSRERPLLAAHHRSQSSDRPHEGRAADDGRGRCRRAGAPADDGRSNPHRGPRAHRQRRTADGGDPVAPAQREAVELAYFGGHTYREIARLQRVPTGTANSRLWLALRKLRAMLQRPDDPTDAARNLAAIDE